ncbi:MAG TPA: hypothetical protein PKE21_13605 [Flavobacteriales bacterium]|nr:hypothetical protein [Flavobacteriales bacterium]HMR28512.1 hypothetical protein [Flavobacteriales bacterium]
MDKGGPYVGAGHVLGVSVQTGTGGPVHRWVHLVRGRRAVHLRGHGEAANAQELIRQVGTRIPMALCIDHERCVHRVVPAEGSAEDQVRRAFAGANVAEVCVSLRVLEGSTGCSMMRRAEAVAIVKALADAGTRVVDLRIGPWDLLSLKALLPEGSGPGASADTWVGLRDGALVLERNAVGPDRSLDLGGDRLPAAHALAFASAWCWLFPGPGRTMMHEDLLAGARSEERARLWYERALLAGLAMILVLVAFEAGLAHRVDREKAVEDGAVQRLADLRAAVEDARAELAAGQALAEAMGAHEAGRLAARAAAIAQLTPPSIRLDRLAVDPVRGAPVQKEPLEVERGVVRIHGRCADAALLNSWMDSLRSRPHAGTVRLLGYRPATDDGGPEFELEIGP